MSWFLPGPKLRTGEGGLWHGPAHLTRSRARVGGSLWVTNERVIFVPGRLVFPRQEDREYPVSELISVSKQDRDYTPYTGGMRKRVRLGFRGGATMSLAVKALDQVVAELQTVVASRGAGSDRI